MLRFMDTWNHNLTIQGWNCSSLISILNMTSSHPWLHPTGLYFDESQKGRYIASWSKHNIHTPVTSGAPSLELLLHRSSISHTLPAPLVCFHSSNESPSECLFSYSSKWTSTALCWWTCRRRELKPRLGVREMDVCVYKFNIMRLLIF